MIVTFLQISLKPQLRLFTWLYHHKAHELSFPMIYCACRNIVNFSHMGRIHTHRTVLWPSWILSGTTWVSRHHKGKTSKTHCRQIQSLSHWYATSTWQCYMHLICYTMLWFPHTPSKKFVSSLTGDINPKVLTGTMEKWKLPTILPMTRQKLSILPSPSKPLLCISIFSNFQQISMSLTVWLQTLFEPIFQWVVRSTWTRLVLVYVVKQKHYAVCMAFVRRITLSARMTNAVEWILPIGDFASVVD